MAFEMQVFGRRLREERHRHKLSQEKLAGLLGTTHSWISELENSRQGAVQAHTVYRLCQALEVSADYLLGLTDAPPCRRAAEETRA